ncbi:MAG TPA: amino acid ABC transporter substrate-binding protein, partial [Burkholderiales bacterium]|nr:amino acid ABC transporter substrate-binding protein [Burkholderiales bacterium]
MKRTLALLATLALAATAAAQEGTLKKIKDSGAITIGHRDASVPFSYYDDKQQPVGYAMDLCARIVEAVKKEVGVPNLKVNYQLVTSANRIPLMANGTIDLECGSTTNNLARQEQVWFATTHFVTANRFVSKRASKIGKLADLKGKTIVSTAGTTNIKQVTEINAEQKLGMNIISANGHAEAFQ